MTPDPAWLARLHAACFSAPRPWSADEFRELLEAPGTLLLAHDHGFVLAQCAENEAEILTIAVHPEQRGQGIARNLIRRLESWLRTIGVRRIFLEVSDANQAARALYASAGYRQAGRRKSYYRAADGTRDDALILSKKLP